MGNVLADSLVFGRAAGENAGKGRVIVGFHLWAAKVLQQRFPFCRKHRKAWVHGHDFVFYNLRWVKEWLIR